MARLHLFVLCVWGVFGSYIAYFLMDFIVWVLILRLWLGSRYFIGDMQYVFGFSMVFPKSIFVVLIFIN